MEEDLGSDCRSVSTTSVISQATEALPSEGAPPAYEDVASEKDATGQRPQTGQPILPQQPGQPFLMGQPDYALPGQPNPVQPVMYTMENIQSSVAFPRPSYPPPHNHLPMAITTMIICALINITSLSTGILALILAVIAKVQIDRGQWKSSKKYSNLSLYLSISNWIYTLSIAIIIIGSIMGPYYISLYNRYGFS